MRHATMNRLAAEGVFGEIVAITRTKLLLFSYSFM
jgi:hypothetical protein